MRVLGKGVAALIAVMVAVLLVNSAGAHGVRSSAAVDVTPRGILTTPSTTPTVTLTVSPGEVISGGQVTLSGTVSGGAPGESVQLYKSPYPFKAFSPVRTTAVSSSGTYSFTDVPDRGTRYRVVVSGTSAQAQGQVNVVARTVIKVKPRPLGRARVTIVVFHPSDLKWGRAKVRWWFATGRHGRFKASPATRTSKVSASAVVLWTTVALPAGHYRWRACVRLPSEGAFVNAKPVHGCHDIGYQGTGFLPAGFPSSKAVGRAARYLGSRTGRTAFAVVDTEERISGVHEHWRFISASVVKAMLLVAYLRRLHARGQHSVDGYSNSFLYPMINVSDNDAATQCWSIVGDSGLYSVAHAAHMTDFSIVGIWANAQISAADQARFFFEMDSILPKEFVGYARRLLSTIVGYESWGIPAIARPRGYQVFFKGGWRSTGLGQLVHQVGRLEGHHRTFSIAVMTDGDPSMGYGIDTIQGVTASLL